MKIGIVGSREFPQLKLVEAFIRDLPSGVVIISGGAKGVDSSAIENAKKYGLEFKEHLPDIEGCTEKLDFTKRYYERNKRIVDDSDLIVAFTEKEKGGTWNTIKQARACNKPVKIIKPNLFFPSNDEPEAEPEDTETESNLEPKKGKGIFHLKRITLGSFALKLKRHEDPLFIADLVNAKDNDPEKFSDLVLPYYLDFFKKYDYGCIHAITQAPKSIRHLDRIHPMDLVCQKVADNLGIKFVKLFEPWDKKSRGCFGGTDLKIQVNENVNQYIGKVVYVLDDFVTTGNTLKKACKALSSLEIHTHGVAYMFWS